MSKRAYEYESPFLTSEMLAKELGVGEHTVRAWRKAGEGPAYIKCGRQIRYAREAVSAWLAANTVGAKP